MGGAGGAGTAWRGGWTAATMSWQGSGAIAGRVADQVVQALVNEGVERIFCVPGESFLGITDALHEAPSIRLIVCRHEGGAGYMAVADGQLSRRPGVCMVSRGPGASNAMIALHSALHDAMPLVVLIGQVRTDERGRQALQEQDYTRWLTDVTKAVMPVDVPSQAAEMIGRAFHVAKSGTPGPVAVILPEDVLEMPAAATLAAPVLRAVAGPAAADLDRLATMLREAERPIVLVGGAFERERSGAALERLAESWGLPVLSTNRRPHLFDFGHQNFGGYVGLRTPAPLMEALRTTDLLVAFGERMTDPLSQSYTFPAAPEPQVPFVHVWPDPVEVGRVWRPTLGLPCDPGEVIAALSRLAAPRVTEARRAWVARLHAVQADLMRPVWQPTEDGVNFAAVACAVARHLSAEAVVTSDAGNFATFIHRYIPFGSRQVFLSSVVGAMGAGVPMAVAAAIREPGRQVVGFAGDGGLMMTGNEIATARLHGAAPVIIVSDNGGYGTIAMHQRGRYPGRRFQADTALHRLDLVQWAGAFGARGLRIEREDEVDSVIAEALSPSPVPMVVQVASSMMQATAWRRFEA